MNKKAKTSPFVWIAGAVLLIWLASSQGWLNLGAGSNTNTNNDNGQATTSCSQNPAYTYTARDSLNGVTASGTTYIKSNSFAPVTSLASPPAGQPLKFWMSNASYFSEVADVGANGAQCGSNVLQTNLYKNGSVTIKAWDVANGVYLTASGGANNLSTSANGLNNVRIDYQGTSKQPAMPFGGCMVVEVPNTVSSVSANGAGISSSLPCPYIYTYAVNSVSDVGYQFAVPAGFDKDGLGDIKSIALQIQAGSSKPTGAFYVRFQPADNYIGNDGNFYLGIQKDKNADVTKVNGATLQQQWVMQ